MGATTKPEVFIIESLSFGDEKKKRMEGRILSQILRLSGKHCEYYYIRTKREFQEVLTRFSLSQYRYLHLSCHGNGHTMSTTLDTIRFQEFADIIRPHLADRRLFVSACSVTNDKLAKLVMPGSGCYSILGPAKDIGFSDAAILWASLYHVMFSVDDTAMKRAVLKAKAQVVANVFQVPLCYVGKKEDSRKGYIVKSIIPKDPIREKA